MKKVFFSLLLFCSTLCLSSTAQNKAEKYCEIIASEGGILRNFKAHISLNYGRVDSLFSFRDSTLIDRLNKVNTLKSFPDVLNYMASLDWKLEAIVYRSKGDSYNFFFEKEFNQSELLSSH